MVTTSSAPAPVPGITEVGIPSLPSRLDSIPPEKLKQLRKLGLEMKDVIKIGRLGVGKGLIQQIKNRWQTSEVNTKSNVIICLSPSAYI
jgi:CRS1 / YhbY (CRM) domain